MADAEKLSQDQLAAHSLLSELRTRIAVQPLPYQYGVEARALESLWEIFGLARKAMKDYPGCQEFARKTTNMLNVDLRPITAKWHRAYKTGILDSKDGANDFRADLAALQIKLTTFCNVLQEMAYGFNIPDEVTPPVIDKDEIDHCFAPIRYGLAVSAANGIQSAAEINKSEAIEIAARRKHYGISKPDQTDAVGMSLSGGGIRSATFCLGVVQVLADRGLMKDFDYLSTVSGGGYIGSFITSFIGRGNNFKDIGKPYGPDTDAVRHVRQNAKYLSATHLGQRWLMVTSTIAGLLLNWTAPICILAVLAGTANFLTLHAPAGIPLIAAKILLSITVGLMIFYGVALRYGAGARLGGQLLACGAGLTLLAFAVDVIERGYLLFSELLTMRWQISGYLFALVISAPTIIKFIPVFRRPSIKKLALNGVVLAVGIITPLLALILFYLFRILGMQPLNFSSSWGLLHYIDGKQILMILIFVSGAVATLLLNVNLTGLHKLYRDQLSNTFVHGDRDEPLSDANPKNGAPYHLINVTVNLPSSGHPVLRDRRGDFFLFSKCWSGAATLGYSPTSEWTSNGVKIDLATAMAISGAAASPQMGRSSIPSFSALLTLLNIRLGYWIVNPKKTRRGTPGFLCLLREMTNTGMSEKNPWLNLSDGGHIENMGIYELLRRRCKFIVCVDGEADPQCTFEGQLTLVRHAQIDFGVRLEPRLDDIRLDPHSKYSRTHSHLLRIHYPAAGPDQPAEIGLMLYLKLSLTGDETEILKRYRMMNPDFPHQSTIDQFYDEEQFEAYRQLGVHVAEGTFSPALLTQNATPGDVESWFRQLASNMLEPTKA